MHFTIHEGLRSYAATDVIVPLPLDYLNPTRSTVPQGIRHPGTYPFCLQELSAWTKPVESSLLTSVPPNIIDSRSLHSPRLSLQRLSDPLLQIYLQQAC
jgi:hypothetical protein